ncbi:hypothetical protein AAF712_008556 [Marasmius tenuissimus]|uniref:Uncharacterized protein n=1 Tax=Marasmius tenuissimus TaxID=585030 RepID=A0ABR2ZSZ9_9AGAR
MSQAGPSNTSQHASQHSFIEETGNLPTCHPRLGWFRDLPWLTSIADTQKLRDIYAMLPEEYWKFATSVETCLDREWAFEDEQKLSQLVEWGSSGRSTYQSIYRGLHMYRLLDILSWLSIRNKPDKVQFLNKQVFPRTRIRHQGFDITGLPALRLWPQKMRNLQISVQKALENQFPLIEPPPTIESSTSPIPDSSTITPSSTSDHTLRLAIWQLRYIKQSMELNELTKVLLSLTEAAFHLSLLKLGLPDIPQTATALQEALEGRVKLAKTATDELSHQLQQVFANFPGSPAKMRGPLFISLMVSPVLLLTGTRASSRDQVRKDMLELFVVLGNDLPKVMQDVHAFVWEALFSIADGKYSPLQALENLLDQIIPMLPPEGTPALDLKQSETVPESRVHEVFFDPQYDSAPALSTKHQETLQVFEKAAKPQKGTTAVPTCQTTFLPAPEPAAPAAPRGLAPLQPTPAPTHAPTPVPTPAPTRPPTPVPAPASTSAPTPAERVPPRSPDPIQPAARTTRHRRRPNDMDVDEEGPQPGEDSMQVDPDLPRDDSESSDDEDDDEDDTESRNAKRRKTSKTARATETTKPNVKSRGKAKAKAKGKGKEKATADEGLTNKSGRATKRKRIASRAIVPSSTTSSSPQPDKSVNLSPSKREASFFFSTRVKSLVSFSSRPQPTRKYMSRRGLTENANDQIIVATFNDLVSNAFSKDLSNPKQYNSLDIPGTASAHEFRTTQLATDITLSRQNVEQLAPPLNQTTTPPGVSNWHLLANTGASHPCHIDTSGYATSICVQTGFKLIIIGVPAKHHSFLETNGFVSFGDFSHDLRNSVGLVPRAIVLGPGDTMQVAPSSFFSLN